jgi:hypothetical protein
LLTGCFERTTSGLPKTAGTTGASTVNEPVELADSADVMQSFCPPDGGPTDTRTV